LVRDPALRDELLDRAERELQAADALFERAAADASLQRELDRRTAGPATPLIAALRDWEERPPEADALLAVNTENVTWLSEIIEVHGWPGLRSVGVEGADAAWLLARHADAANEARRAWLPVLGAAVESGDADPRHFATLVDRTAVIAGELQQYGTIVVLADDGEPELTVPVHDAGKLDERRASIGLPTLDEEAPWLAGGEIVPYGPDRGAAPINQWPQVLEGHVSVESALEAGIRPIHRIWAARPGDRRLGRLRALARERGVTIDQVEAAAVDELAEGRSHGGVIALVGPRRTLSVHQLLAEVGDEPLVVMLDGIEDPFNFGQAVRALYAAGVDGLVVRRSWETALATVTRASAGATELLVTATAAAPEEAAAACRARGMRVACAVADPLALEVHQADLRGGLFLLIGGERRGVTRSFVDEADLQVRIGYGRAKAPDLGAAAAAAIIGFEALRQRSAEG
jgi:23S rRNA (guanosine2251-2'-O)-methyltransferase